MTTNLLSRIFPGWDDHEDTPHAVPYTGGRDDDGQTAICNELYFPDLYGTST